MLKPGTRHRKLAIVVSPDGEFHYPTSPDNYGYPEAAADALSGRRRFTFQKLDVRETRIFHRKIWVATEKAEHLDEMPGWKPLDQRPYCYPNAITPKRAEELSDENRQ